jgi:murein L,D-transpeptidase YcbB/YkuD
VGAADSDLYDPSLVEAVRSFQVRHGLEVDGIVGPVTLRQLRVPPSERALQIELAIERLRWFPEPLGERFIIVNIPAFRLLAFEADLSAPRLVIDVVVGKAARLMRTPVMHADMTTVVFRPYWEVPPGIAKREILPRIERDPGYLKRQRMEIVGGRVRQRPGEGNALGLVKFLLPNRYQVYLHDTPARALFGRARRDFSHGCIRLADAPALAEFVLANRPGWDRQRIEEAMRRGKNDVHIAVDPPIPVYLFYTTAIVDSEDRVHFFDDIYGHDAALREMLALSPPPTRATWNDGPPRC